MGQKGVKTGVEIEFFDYISKSLHLFFKIFYIVIEVDKALLLLKSACLGKIWFSRYRAKRGLPPPLRLRIFFEKKILRFFLFSFLIISFNSIQVFPLMFSCSHTHHQWHQDLDFFRLFPIFYSICFNSIFFIYVFCIFFIGQCCQSLCCRILTALRPVRPGRCNSQRSWAIWQKIVRVCVCLSVTQKLERTVH